MSETRNVGDSLIADLAWRIPPLPPAREFVTSAGFAGAAALMGAIIIALAVLIAVRRGSKRHQALLEQRESHHRELRDRERHAQAIERCWQRLVWVVETAGIEPAAAEGAALGLGPELALEVLRGILRDAEHLADDTLIKAAAVHLNQFALVLSQQGGPLAELAAAQPAAAGETPAVAEVDKSIPGSETPSAAPAGGVQPSGKAQVAVKQRRWRR
ncbi:MULTISPECIES: hypothetical protein [Mycobacterium ulcerans group]|nr:MULTISPECIES: hypothetical protein [Mycobacterium ulcerans group]